MSQGITVNHCLPPGCARGFPGAVLGGGCDGLREAPPLWFVMQLGGSALHPRLRAGPGAKPLCTQCAGGVSSARLPTGGSPREPQHPAQLGSRRATGCKGSRSRGDALPRSILGLTVVSYRILQKHLFLSPDPSCSGSSFQKSTGGNIRELPVSAAAEGRRLSRGRQEGCCCHHGFWLPSLRD